MTNNYQENKDSTSQQFEEPESAVEMYENQLINTPPFNKSINIYEDINNNDTNYHTSLCSVSQEYLSLNNITQTHENSNEFSFNPQEWSITDTISGKTRAPRQNEFLYLLLQKPRYSSYIYWVNRNEGLFTIHEPERVATLWKKVKNRQTKGIMNYETFARGVRYYYKSGLMIKTNKKYTFRFKIPINSTS